MTKPDNKANLPNLKILPVANLVAHELYDNTRAIPLATRLSQEATLINPPIVTPLDIDKDRFMILDGTNRVAAFQHLEIPHIIAQIVPYDEPYIQLETWHHVISNISNEDLRFKITNLTDTTTKPNTILHAKALLARRTIVAYVIFKEDYREGRVLTLGGGGQDLRKNNQILQAAVNIYIESSTLNRSNIDDPLTLFELFPDMTAAFIFPNYNPAEVVDLAQNSLCVPPGITRHLVQGRALHLHYPIDRLRSPIPLEEKNQELTGWFQEKFASKKVRYYAESTYIFSE